MKAQITISTSISNVIEGDAEFIRQHEQEIQNAINQAIHEKMADFEFQFDGLEQTEQYITSSDVMSSVNLD